MRLYIKDILDRLLAGETDYSKLLPDVWKLDNPQAVRVYREESRYKSDRKQLDRARRIIAAKQKRPQKTDQPSSNAPACGVRLRSDGSRLTRLGLAKFGFNLVHGGKVTNNFWTRFLEDTIHVHAIMTINLKYINGDRESVSEVSNIV